MPTILIPDFNEHFIFNSENNAGNIRFISAVSLFNMGLYRLKSIRRHRMPDFVTETEHRFIEVANAPNLFNIVINTVNFSPFERIFFQIPNAGILPQIIVEIEYEIDFILIG